VKPFGSAEFIGYDMDNEDNNNLSDGEARKN
jgi:hypothetical protein